MIKTFDQFTAIEEGLFKKSSKKVNYFEQYRDLLQKCMEFNSEFVKAAGGEVDFDTDDTAWVWKDRFNANSDKNEIIKSGVIKGVKLNGSDLIMMTDNEDEIILDEEHVDDSTIFYISKLLCEIEK